MMFICSIILFLTVNALKTSLKNDVDNELDLISTQRNCFQVNSLSNWKVENKTLTIQGNGYMCHCSYSICQKNSILII